MNLRTLQEIIDELKADIQRRNPAISDWSSLSVNLTLAQAYCKQIYDLEQLISTTADSLWVNTATGADLDKLVVDRLPAGRQPGTKAIGDVTFSRTSAAPVSITVPIGTIVSQPNSNGVPVYFETTELGTMTSGTTSVTVGAEAMVEGENGNAPSGTIIGLVNVPSGITSVTNALAFYDGTDQESDDALRKRYIYSVNIPGRATESMIEQHLLDMANVTEAQVFTILPGIIELIVDDTKTITDVTEEAAIEATILDNIAAGIVARGTIGATIVGGTDTPSVDTCAGGNVFAVVDSVPAGIESITIGYKNQLNNARTSAALTIPAASAIGSSFEFTLQASSDRCIEITSVTYAGSGDYTLVMGLGDYPWLYNYPTTISTNVTVVIVQTATPETDLLTNIEASLTACLNDYTIGRDIEFSDIAKYIYVDYDTGRAFVGIESITSVSIVAKSTTITAFGDTIAIANDERVRAGTISVT